MAAPKKAGAKARREQIVALRLAGHNNQAELARRFAVSPATINKDFAAINEAWRDKWADDVKTWKAQDADRIEQLIAAIWPKALDPDIKGQTFFIDRVIALLDRRAKLLGLDAPMKVDLGDRVRELRATNGWDDDAEAGVLAEVETLLRGART